MEKTVGPQQTPGHFFHRRLSELYPWPGLFAAGHRNAGRLGRNFRVGWERHAHKTAEILLALSRAAGTDRDYLLHLQRRPGLSKESDPRIRPASRLRRAYHRFHHRNPIWNRSEQSLETKLPDHTAAVRILPNPCERRREIIVSLDGFGTRRRKDLAAPLNLKSLLVPKIGLNNVERNDFAGSYARSKLATITLIEYTDGGREIIPA